LDNWFALMGVAIGKGFKRPSRMGQVVGLMP
jgi:hypothetical protein